MPGAYRYWRVRGYEASTGGNGSIAATEVQFRTTPGGANVATGGVASASSIFSTFVAANAFDGNSATVFSSDSGSPQWLQYDFLTPVEINEIYWALNAGLSGACRSMDVYSSDNNREWLWEWGHYRMADWVASEARTMTRPGAPVFSARTRWRVISPGNAVMNGGNIASIAEVEFRATVGGAPQSAGGTAISDSFFDGTSTPSKAYDGSGSTFWTSANAGGPHWVGYQHPSAFYCQELRLLCRADLNAFMPTTVILQSCDDDKTWADAHWIEGLTWTTGQSQLFQQPVYTDAELAIAAAAAETLDGGGSRSRVGVAAAAAETLDGGGSRSRVGVAVAAAEGVIGPPVSRLWLAAVAIESIISAPPATGRARNGPVQIIAG